MNQYSTFPDFTDDFITEEAQVLDGFFLCEQLDYLAAEYRTMGLFAELSALNLIVARYETDQELLSDMIRPILKSHLAYKYAAGMAPAYFVAVSK